MTAEAILTTFCPVVDCGADMASTALMLTQTSVLDGVAQVPGGRNNDLAMH